MKRPTILLAWAACVIACGVRAAPAATPAGGGAAPSTAPAVRVGDRAQLFIDSSLIASSEGITFTPQLATKHPKPVLEADQPWERFVALYGDVMYDEQEKRFKMWYVAALPPEFTYGGERVTAQATCYATSRDGMTWEKPFVGTLKSERFAKHNVVAPVQAPVVFKDVDEPDAAKRYKLVGVSRLAGNVKPKHPTDTFTSPDGFRWTPLGRDIHTGTQDDVHGFFDPRTKQYVVFLKQWPYPQVRGPKRRVYGVMTSGDFVNWTKPLFPFGADEEDDAVVTQHLDAVRDHFEFRDNPYTNARADVYGISVYPHESGTVLAFPWLFYYHRSTKSDPKELRDEGTSEIQIAVLRDGHARWERGPRRPVLTRGGWGEWDSGWLMAANKLLRVGDELWLYYDGGNWTHGFNPKWFDEPRTITRDGKTYTWTYKRAIGLAKWKLDRFIAAEANEAGGTLTMVPLVFSGLNLELNARVRAGGSIVVQILDESGMALDEFGKSDALVGDGLRQPVAFPAGDLAALIGTPVTLRLHVKDAELYGFAFRN